MLHYQSIRLLQTVQIRKCPLELPLYLIKIVHISLHCLLRFAKTLYCFKSKQHLSLTQILTAILLQFLILPTPPHTLTKILPRCLFQLRIGFKFLQNVQSLRLVYLVSKLLLFIENVRVRTTTIIAIISTPELMQKSPISLPSEVLGA